MKGLNSQRDSLKRIMSSNEYERLVLLSSPGLQPICFAHRPLLSSKNPHFEFYLHENEKRFPYQRLSTYLRFETEARGNSKMAYSSFTIFANTRLHAKSHVRNSLLSRLARCPRSAFFLRFIASRFDRNDSIYDISRSASMNIGFWIAAQRKLAKNHVRKRNVLSQRARRDTPFITRSRWKLMNINYPCKNHVHFDRVYYWKNQVTVIFTSVLNWSMRTTRKRFWNIRVIDWRLRDANVGLSGRKNVLRKLLRILYRLRLFVSFCESFDRDWMK